MAAIKLDYKDGLFITNARISPQAKREYLDNYPGLSLDFMDGEGLITEVLSSPLLSALWLGTEDRLSRVNTRVSLPFLVRRHSDDASILPLKHKSIGDPNIVIQRAKTICSDCHFEMIDSVVSPERFEPYRMPEPFTSEEGPMPFVHATEFIIIGAISIDGLSDLRDELLKGLHEWCGNLWNDLTIRVGQPALTPLEGSQTGNKIDLNIAAKSYIVTPHSGASEIDWFVPPRMEPWTAICDARVTESEWVRLYHPKLDCCLAYEITGRTSYLMRYSLAARREIGLMGWEKSTFCLMPAWKEWPFEELPPPDEWIPWNDGRVLCGWFYWTFFGGIIGFRSANKIGENFFETPSEADEIARLDSIKTIIATISCAEPVEPSKARHIVALVNGDPFPDDDFITFRTADVFEAADAIPSPILPRSRNFSATIAWKREIDLNELLEVACKSATFESKILATPPTGEVIDNFTVIETKLDMSNPELPTELILDEFQCVLETWLSMIEQQLPLS